MFYFYFHISNIFWTDLSIFTSILHRRDPYSSYENAILTPLKSYSRSSYWCATSKVHTYERDCVLSSVCLVWRVPIHSVCRTANRASEIICTPNWSPESQVSIWQWTWNTLYFGFVICPCIADPGYTKDTGDMFLLHLTVTPYGASRRPTGTGAMTRIAVRQPLWYVKIDHINQPVALFTNMD